MKNEIIITRKEFHDKMSEIMCELASNPFDAIKFAMLCTNAEIDFFGDDEEDDDTDTETPFKVGDNVFVIDNVGDSNGFVNQVVTVKEVVNDYKYKVTNGKITQSIYFNNLRKVETP